MSDLTSACYPIDEAAVLAWFTGRALDRARDALRDLAEAIQLGYWQPKASRRVRAALNKQASARAFARGQEHARENGRLVPPPADGTRRISDIVIPGESRHSNDGWRIVHAMMFGIVDLAPDLKQRLDAVDAQVRTDAERDAVAQARRWQRAFAPVALAMQALDARRPQPTYVLAELTARTVDNLARRVGVDCTSATVPPIQWREVVGTVDGKQFRQWVGDIQWLPGTRHGRSRFGDDSEHCEACGARIRSQRWFPLQLDGASGPASLWVGSDCARRLLGARVAGEGTLVRDAGAAP